MNKEKSIVELKKMCKKYNITGYSKLNKSDLIKIINKKMKGGNFDESNIKDAYYPEILRKKMAESPNFFLAFLKDNVNLFNDNSGKPEITVKCRLPNGQLIEKTGEVYAVHESLGFIIIYCE